MSEGMARRLVGVLGGMGPLATVDFLGKMIAAAERLLGAKRDQDHVPMIVYDVPQVPDRNAAIAEHTDTPVAPMLAGLEVLAGAGATCAVIVCNTAHAWFETLSAQSRIPVLHIADACVAALARSGVVPGRVGLLSTQGTRDAGFYQKRLAEHTIGVELPSAEDAAAIAEAIYAVKRSDLARARTLLEPVASHLLERGVEGLLLACTELPPAFAQTPYADRCIDATTALAEASVLWSAGQAGGSAGGRASGRGQASEG